MFFHTNVIKFHKFCEKTNNSHTFKWYKHLLTNSNIKLFYFLHSTHIMYSAVADYKYSNYKISHSNTELIRNGNYITSINQTYKIILIFLSSIFLSSDHSYSLYFYSQFNLIFLLEYNILSFNEYSDMRRRLICCIYIKGGNALGYIL